MRNCQDGPAVCTAVSKSPALTGKCPAPATARRRTSRDTAMVRPCRTVRRPGTCHPLCIGATLISPWAVCSPAAPAPTVSVGTRGRNRPARALRAGRRPASAATPWGHGPPQHRPTPGQSPARHLRPRAHAGAIAGRCRSYRRLMQEVCAGYATGMARPCKRYDRIAALAWPAHAPCMRRTIQLAWRSRSSLAWASPRGTTPGMARAGAVKGVSWHTGDPGQGSPIGTDWDYL